MNLSAFRILAMLLTGLLTACAVGLSPQRTEPFPVGLPFERGLMAYARGDLDTAYQELQAAIDRDRHDKRARELLAVVIKESGRKVEPQRLTDQPVETAVTTAGNYLALVVGRNPQLRQAMFRVTEKRAALRIANLDIGPELSIMTRFYPEAIFAALTQTVTSLLQRPAKLEQGEAELMAALADYARIKNDVMGEAVNNYFNLLAASRQLAWIDAELRARDHYLAIAHHLSGQGYLDPSLYALAQAEYAKAEQLRVDTEGRFNTASVRLADLAGLERTHLALAASSGWLLPLPSPQGFEQQLGDISTHDAAVASAEAQGQAERAAKTITLLSLPEIDLYGSYGKPFTSDRVTFVRGFASGAHIRLPLLIWPLQKARADEHDAIVAQLETEVEHLVGKARHELVLSYERLRLAAQALRAAESAAAADAERVRIVEQQRRLGHGDNRLLQIEPFIAYYRDGYLQVAARYEEQKAAFRWLRAQGALAEDLPFEADTEMSPAPPVNAYMNQAPRAIWIRDTSFLNDAERMGVLLDFVAIRRFKTLFLFATPTLLQQFPDAYRQFLGQAHAHGLRVEAYNGSSAWLIDQGEDAHDFARAVRDFAAPSPAQRFDGLRLHFSAPSLGAALQQQRFDWLAAATELLLAIRNSDLDDGMTLGVDLPDWSGETVRDATLDSLSQAADDVVVFVEPTSLKSASPFTAAQAQRIWLGLSLPVPAAAPIGEFSGNRVETLLSNVAGTEWGKSGMKGIAIYDLQSYQRILADESGRD